MLTTEPYCKVLPCFFCNCIMSTESLSFNN